MSARRLCYSVQCQAVLPAVRLTKDLISTPSVGIDAEDLNLSRALQTSRSALVDIKANFSSFPTSSWVKRSETSPATMPSVIRLRRKKTSSAWRFRDMTAPAGSHRLSSSSIGMPFISRRQDVTEVSIALRLDSSSINGLDCAVDGPELVLSLSRFLPAFE